MPIEVFIAVLMAALLHACWNAFLKADADRLGMIQAMSTAQMALSMLLLPFVPLPAPASWPCLAASGVVNVAPLFLVRAYRTGDLGQVYPLARGTAPLIVSAVSVLFLGERLDWPSQVGVILIGLGVTSLCLARGSEGLRDRKMVAFALGTGVFIATYSLLDGHGARLAANPHAYVVWLSLLGAILIVLTTRWIRPRSSAPPSGRTRALGYGAGLISYVGAWTVIWAMTQAPIPLVSALRESSIVFAVVIGVVAFDERLNVARLVSVAATLVGALLVKAGR